MRIGDLDDLKRATTSFTDCDGFNPVWQIIDNAPTVDIKDQIAGAYNEGYACGSRENTRPQGEWTIGYTAKQKKVAVCNLCNCISFQGKTNFCHNCGADMRKGGAE